MADPAKPSVVDDYLAAVEARVNARLLEKAAAALEAAAKKQQEVAERQRTEGEKEARRQEALDRADRQYAGVALARARQVNAPPDLSKIPWAQKAPAIPWAQKAPNIPWALPANAPPAAPNAAAAMHAGASAANALASGSASGAVSGLGSAAAHAAFSLGGTAAAATPYIAAVTATTGAMIALAHAANPSAVSTLNSSIGLLAAQVGQVFTPAIQNASAALQNIAESGLITKLTEKRADGRSAAEVFSAGFTLFAPSLLTRINQIDSLKGSWNAKEPLFPALRKALDVQLWGAKPKHQDIDLPIHGREFNSGESAADALTQASLDSMNQDAKNQQLQQVLQNLADMGQLLTDIKANTGGMKFTIPAFER